MNAMSIKTIAAPAVNVRFAQAILCAGLGAAAGLCAQAAQASDYPVKPIQIIVPSTPGGSVDTLTRVIGAQLSTRLGQPVVVVNRPGAGGTLAAEFVQRAAPDGYTLIMGTVSSFATNVSLERKLPYDPLKDFIAVSLVGTQNLVLVTHPSIAAKSVADIVALAKAHPGKLTFASAGVGTGGHLSGELFKLLAGLDMLHVPYKGVAPALIDVMNNNVSMTFASTMSATGQIKDGKLRAFAVTGDKHAAALPDLPTMAQAGVKGYQSETWYGLFAPAGTPRPIVQKISSTVASIIHQPEIAAQLSAEGVDMVGSTPEAFTAFDKAEIEKWAKVIKAAGLRKP